MLRYTSEYSCDGGSLMIHSGGLGFRVPNGIGDGRYKFVVDYSNTWDNPSPKAEFIQTFIVSPEHIAYISNYDLDFNETYRLDPGFYSVYSDRGTVYIMWHEN